MPTPIAWTHRAFYAHNHADWNSYFNRIYELEARGCISPKGYERATSWVAESMPAPAVLASFFRDSLDRRGFVALRPGMRLFIERSIFRAGRAQTLANYLGDTRVYYEVVRRSGDQVALRVRRIRRSKELPRKADRKFPDEKLSPAFKGMHALRLFYLTLYVPPSLQRNALLLGARNPEAMIRASRRIEKNPEIPCRDLVPNGIRCASFEGMVSASVEINVSVNGKREYFPVGTKIESLLNFLPPPERAEAWKTLRIRRLFRGRHYDMKFRRDDRTVRLLVLFAGDQISWANRSSSSPRQGHSP